MFKVNKIYWIKIISFLQANQKPINIKNQDDHLKEKKLSSKISKKSKSLKKNKN